MRRSQYKQLGKQLPPKKSRKIPGAGLRVSINGKVCIPSVSRGKTNYRDRDFTAKLSANQANRMQQGDFGAIFNAYGLELGVISSIDLYAVSVDFL